eukprot:680194-Prymnesium_polylepis.1
MSCAPAAASSRTGCAPPASRRPIASPACSLSPRRRWHSTSRWCSRAARGCRSQRAVRTAPPPPALIWSLRSSLPAVTCPPLRPSGAPHGGHATGQATRRRAAPAPVSRHKRPPLDHKRLLAATPPPCAPPHPASQLYDCAPSPPSPPWCALPAIPLRSRRVGGVDAPPHRVRARGAHPG